MKKGNFMLGLSLSVWNMIVVVFLGLSAFSAVILGIAQFCVIRIQDREALTARQEFDKYRASVAIQVEDARREGVQAGRDAGNALERAAELEKEAALARLEAEKIKEAVSWREVSSNEATLLLEALALKPGSVNLRYVDGDPETLSYAIQIGKLLKSAGWRVAPGASKPANALPFEIHLWGPQGDDLATLQQSFAKANLGYFSEAVLSNVEFNVSTIQGAPTILIGSRRPRAF